MLEAFDLDLPRGQLSAIVGRSGCGKSSLLRLLAGVRPPDRGTVSGVPSRRGFVFQDPALLPWRSLRENVALPGQLGVDTEAVDAAIARVGLADHADKLPAELSGGQRMRASLARALVSRPEILFLDEPFAALDGATRRDLASIVAALLPGVTVVMVTHDLADAARLADRVVLVDGPPLRVVLDLPVGSERPRAPSEVAAVVARVEAVGA
ncbi:MAG: ATP-binding cassette domain-containing protein [Deltaproteobacteria bacterium]|nr:ATP-binding cassette domain-containing protein [Deltaproteobacteria bacterium]